MAGGCLGGPREANWWLEMAGIGLLGAGLCNGEEEREVCMITWI